MIRWIARVGVVSAFLLAAVFPFARAQLLLEVQLVAAISAELNPAINFPVGSFRAVGPGTETVIARVADAGSWRNWEVYAAQGITASLQPAFVQQVATSFALAGFFQSEMSESQVGNEMHTRYVFSDGSSEMLLYVIRSPQELVWMIAESP